MANNDLKTQFRMSDDEKDYKQKVPSVREDFYFQEENESQLETETVSHEIESGLWTKEYTHTQSQSEHNPFVEPSVLQSAGDQAQNYEYMPKKSETKKVVASHGQN